ncbi:MAG: hypothetical protein IFJ96_01245 [Acidobacteria bacterium]|nr:hypothetical protein [Candidatus Sulfomarinibacter sp. MAG AM2]
MKPDDTELAGDPGQQHDPHHRPQQHRGDPEENCQEDAAEHPEGDEGREGHTADDVGQNADHKGEEREPGEENDGAPPPLRHR